MRKDITTKRGRELDAEICETIQGWTECISVPKDATGKNAGLILGPYSSYRENWVYPSKGNVGREYFCPPYSSNMEVALELARAVELPLPVKDLPETAEELAILCLEFYKAVK